MGEAATRTVLSAPDRAVEQERAQPVGGPGGPVRRSRGSVTPFEILSKRVGGTLSGGTAPRRPSPVPSAAAASRAVEREAVGGPSMTSHLVSDDELEREAPLAGRSSA